MSKDFLLIYVLFLLVSLSLRPEVKNSKVEFIDPFKNAVETKIKYWYDPNDITKTPLAAMNIVTKYETNHWFWKKIENASRESIESWGMEFQVPLKLAKGNMVFSTNQLAYYLE